MYLLAKGEHGEAMAFSTDKIAKILVYNVKEEEQEPDEFRIMGVTTEGYGFEAEHSCSNSAEAAEDLLMLIYGIEKLQEQGQAFITIYDAIKYAREQLDRVKDGSGKAVKEEKTYEKHN